MKTIAIAGATGFIGRWFIEKYRHKYKIVALSRRKALRNDDPQVEWRQVELYSITSTTEALAGADYALYLVHSMNPSTRLNQGSFEDTDLLLADNFARAAEQNGLEQIVFIGGILPKDPSEFSRHLRSRYETELTLGGRATPLTALRAGIIVGPGGSSFEIVEKLVNRLPAMGCPKWTQSESQPIALSDTLRLIDHCFGNPDTYGKAYEIGGNETMTYMDVIRTTIELTGKKRMVFKLPFFTLGLSKLWVALFTDSSPTFVSPLVESLRHTMTVNPEYALRIDGMDYKPVRQAIDEALHQKDSIPATPAFEKSVVEEKNTVRSHQRLPNPAGKTAFWVAKSYQKWLPRLFRYLIRARVEQEDEVSFHILNMREPALRMRLVRDRSDDDRQLFYIVGGMLVKRRDYGWLEFRRVLGGRYVIAAIHEFVPRLPWYVYVNTQAVIHLWVMRRFGRFLAKTERQARPPEPYQAEID